MANPRGNTHRCKKCGALAGIDNWCKRHRPFHRRWRPFRDNFIESKDYKPIGEKYGIEDVFPIARK